MESKLSRRQFELAALSAFCGAAGVASRSAVAQRVQLPGEVPWLGETQRPPGPVPANAPPVRSLMVDSRGRRILNRTAWETRASEIRVGWEQFLSSWEYPRQPPEYEILDTERFPTVTRRLIRYQSERNVSVEAYLLEPKRTPLKVPGVVVFHSTVDYTIRQGAGLEGEPGTAWGLRLAERGMVALCPRCFLWDGSEPPNYLAQVQAHERRHPGTRGMTKMLFDGHRALDLLASLEQVDPERLGACGHSLGAKETLYLAAFDTRVKAAVFSEGGISLDFSNWDAPWYLGLKPPGHDHHELLALVAPRAFLVIGGESADGAKSWPLVERAIEAYRIYGEPCHIGLYDHGQGHRVPPAAEGRVYQWLEAYL